LGLVEKGEDAKKNQLLLTRGPAEEAIQDLLGISAPMV
jgi:hypothetical protein